MTENQEKGSIRDSTTDPDLRFKYLGFEVKPGRIGNLFKNEDDKRNWIQRILERRQTGSKMREECTLTAPRVASYEKIILTITSLLLVFSLFLPWFSGYEETTITPATTSQESGISSSTGEAGTQTGQKDESGFTSLSATRKKQEVRREYYSTSALGALGSIGDFLGKMLTSGIALMLTGLLYIIYILLCPVLAVYNLYAIYGIKGDPDSVALKFKKVLKYNWLPVIIWTFCLIISVAGGDYSFSTSGSIKQLGNSYGLTVYLGILSWGFYMSLAAFIVNAIKAVEI